MMAKCSLIPPGFFAIDSLTGMFFSLLRLLKRAGLYVSAPAELQLSMKSGLLENI